MNESATLEERDHLAEDGSEDEVSQQGADQGERHAENAQRQVGDGQVEQEQVGDGAHRRILHQRQDDQHVSRYAQHKDDAAVP